ncbi:hypothetical protein MUK42_34587 [Musa troglodytarum]|uniref:Uncharacterized protein n=1 Tax=Musa troglodytarum TaxID=320322 RepID=A0A9E7G5U5_9LILI|nr:hypothetical protein MUK42_34587 [Musa troglodytarum]
MEKIPTIPTRAHRIAIEPFQKSVGEFGFSHQKLVLAIRRSRSERKRRKGRTFAQITRRRRLIGDRFWGKGCSFWVLDLES